MVNVIATSVKDREFDPRSCKGVTVTSELVFSALNMHHKGVKTNTSNQ